MQLKGTCAIITGSSSGVGAATALALAAQGCNVVINYSNSETAALAVAAQCETLGVEVAVVKANVAQDSDCQRLVDTAIQRWGRLDILVNNAGTTKFVNHQDLAGLDKQDFLDIYSVNTIGPFQMVRAAEPYLRKSGNAAVVNVASIAAVTGVGSSIAYAASKGAMVTMTLSLARVMGPEIRVNAVCPGFIQGKWLEQGMGKENYAKMKAALEASSPLNSTATAETVAESIMFFIAGASVTTGETLILDGGLHLQQTPLARR